MMAMTDRVRTPRTAPGREASRFRPGFVVIWILALGPLLPVVPVFGQDVSETVIFDLQEFFRRADPGSDPGAGEADREAAADSEPDERASDGAGATDGGLAESIARLIRERVPEESTVRVIAPFRVLVISTAEGLERARELLDLQRRSLDLFFSIDTAFARVDEAGFQRAFGGEDTGVLEDSRTLGELEIFREEDWDVLTSPRILVNNAMTMSVSIGERVPYVKAWEEREVELPEVRTFEVPIIEEIEDGVVLRGRVIRVGERAMDVDFSLRFTELMRPVPVESTPFGLIAVPEVRRSEVDARMTLMPDTTAYFSVREDDGRRLVLFVKARAVRPELEDVTWPR